VCSEGGLPRSPRLDVGFGPAADPQYTFAPLIQFDEDYTRWPEATAGKSAPQRVAWHHYAQTYGDNPLVLRYDGLDRVAEYLPAPAKIQIFDRFRSTRAVSPFAPTAPQIFNTDSTCSAVERNGFGS
jgi:hypothetical protein